jgi:hypothetical protein
MLGDKVMLFVQAFDPLILGFLPSLGWQACAATPSFFSVEMGFQTFFFIGWPATASPPQHPM